MKKELLLLTASLVAIGSAMPAFGADLATRPAYTKAPPLVAAAYDWSGFYLGINGGWGTSRNCWNFSGTDEGCHDSNGGTLGGQIGYRWQMGQLVLGVEGQGNWADFSGSNVSLAFAPAVNQSKINAFGLMTGQVGYAWNNVLLYAKGGAAVTNTSYTSFVSSGGAVFANANDDTRWGGVIGAGIEYGFAPNWSAGVEYNHLFMQDRTLNFNIAGGGTFAEGIRQDVDLVTARINYKFGGPIVAKY